MALARHKATGREVRLSAMKMRINRRPGIGHSIVFTDREGGRPEGDWSCYMEKPYPKAGDRPLDAMLAKWADENETSE